MFTRYEENFNETFNQKEARFVALMLQYQAIGIFGAGMYVYYIYKSQNK